jgi:hypothetical protein
MEDDLLELGFEHKTMPEAYDEVTQVPIEHVPAETILNSLTPVAYDDVLDMHQYLNSFDGDFTKVIQ